MKNVVVCALLLCAACAPAAQSPPAPRPAEPQVVPPAVRPRYAVRPVRTTDAVRRAIENGTRTDDGRPGPAYWQQRVEYRIEAELDPATATLRGEQVVLYRNNSPDTLGSIVMHLYQNAFAEGVERVRGVPITGGTTIRRIAVNNVEARPVRAAGTSSYDIDGTLMRIELARPLMPGASIELEVGWEFVVPPAGAPRTGHDENEAFVVAQWYPQIAVYDDLHGWHARPYWTNGEFYLEYGDFEVLLTLPEGWVVTATGELDNPEEVLTPDVLGRIDDARSSDEVVNVITAEDLEQDRATVREPGGQLTWRFHARNVRDFAFATSNRYLWDATRVTWPGADTSRHVLVNALYRPDASPAWRDAAAFMRHALAFHANHWGAYIYPHISAAEGPIGGMEYPMLVFIGGTRTPQSLYSVLSHEIAHEWWPMMVGSNESQYAWQDEGLATYVEDMSLADRFTGATPELDTQNSYLNIAGTDIERPIMTEPDLFGIGPQYGVAAYTKPGSLLRALSVVIGEAAVQDALREYTTRWLLRHPSPYDFFNVVEDVHGADLDWFWSPWFFDTVALDHAITDVSVETVAAGERVTITIEDHGGAPMPVPVVITLADGTTRDVLLPVEPWLEGAVAQTTIVESASPVTRVEIDPARYLPDVLRSNNVWVRQ